ncbi:MAG: protein translocase subunit SecD, partial [Desulfobacterales bacterium]|nr:protein translocase subunit SecD [Desulfobacterales bacterium]
MKNLSWRLTAVLVVIIVAVALVMPTAKMYMDGTKEPALWPHRKINLGLDLQGGMHLVLEVQTDDAVRNAMDVKISNIREALRKKAIKHRNIKLDEPTSTLSLRLLASEDIGTFRAVIADNFPELEVVSVVGDGSASNIKLGMKPEVADQKRKLATDQALETIRNRVDEFGVSEPDIRKQGDNRILIQLAGITDTKSAKDLIGKTATLTFRMVDESMDVRTAMASGAPRGSEILYLKQRDSLSGTVSSTPILVKKRVRLTGESLADARLSFDRMNNDPQVSIKFDSLGAREFARITKENVGRRLAIVLDQNVYSAPSIREPILQGEAKISGGFTLEEAKVLAIALRAGALPAEVKILEERTVGPTLGADSIRNGLISMMIGGICVIFF